MPILDLFKQAHPFPLEYHETAANSRAFQKERRLLLVFRDRLLAAGRALGPGFEARWHTYGGLTFFGGPIWGDKSMANDPDPLTTWRRNVRSLRDLWGKEKRIEVYEYGKDPWFEATWTIKGVDANPWWTPGLYSNVWEVELTITLRQALSDKGCDVTYEDVTEKRGIVGPECKALATSIR